MYGSPNLSVLVLGDGAFGGFRWNSEGGALLVLLMPLQEETPKSLFPFSPSAYFKERPHEDTVRKWPSATSRESPPQALALDLELPDSSTV